MTYNAP